MKMIRLLLVTAVLQIPLCTTGNDYVSTNQRSSACGGFNSLAKQSINVYTHDSLDYCEAEKIRWEYDSISTVLGLLHTRQLENCAAKLRMYVHFENGKYIIEEINENESAVNARCMCYFDTYCEIENITGSSCLISYKGKDYSFELKKRCGYVELETDAGWPCK